MLDEAPVDEEVLLAAGFAGVFGLADEAFDFQQVGLLLDVEEALLAVVAEELADALEHAAGLEVVEQAPIGGEGESYVAVDECDATEYLLDV